MNPKRLITLVAAIGAIGFSSAAFSQYTAYDAIPSPQPSNVPSLGYEATATDELGDYIMFAGPHRKVRTVDVLMSSWACESGSWSPGPCSTTPGSGFSHPITLNIYAAVVTGTVPVKGALLATKTATFFIPYRPSANPTCADTTQWKDASGACFSGLAVPITFNLVGDNVTLPDEVIYGVSYDTRTSGPSPIGVDGPYDSLNVGLAVVPPSVGVDVEPDALFWDTAIAANYSDGGTGGVDVFRRDTDWTPYTPAVRFSLVTVPTSANDCKKGGWMALSRADGTSFKNQGDCVSYFRNGK